MQAGTITDSITSNASSASAAVTSTNIMSGSAASAFAAGSRQRDDIVLAVSSSSHDDHAGGGSGSNALYGTGAHHTMFNGASWLVAAAALSTVVGTLVFYWRRRASQRGLPHEDLARLVSHHPANSASTTAHQQLDANSIIPLPASNAGGGVGRSSGYLGRRVRGFMRATVGGRGGIGPRRVSRAGAGGTFLSPLRAEHLFERELLTELAEARS